MIIGRGIGPEGFQKEQLRCGRFRDARGQSIFWLFCCRCRLDLHGDLVCLLVGIGRGGTDRQLLLKLLSNVGREVREAFVVGGGDCATHAGYARGGRRRKGGVPLDEAQQCDCEGVEDFMNGFFDHTRKILCFTELGFCLYEWVFAFGWAAKAGPAFRIVRPPTNDEKYSSLRDTLGMRHKRKFWNRMLRCELGCKGRHFRTIMKRTACHQQQLP